MKKGNNMNSQKRLENVTLEMTLKPFRNPEEASIKQVIREMLLQWRPLLKRADMISIMLWIADGSEILEYNGEMEDRLEWACYLGRANKRNTASGQGKIYTPEDKEFLDGTITSRDLIYYMASPPVLTYGWLKKLVGIIKKTGNEVTGKPVRVGATFDPGPEFAISEFKYGYHAETTTHPRPMLSDRFVRCNAVMNADTRKYAGFPRGVPQGMRFGTFFGRQTNKFLTDMNFDYIWFSNAFGFGIDSWGGNGSICYGSVFYDGAFHPGNCVRSRKDILEFWSLFRAECPGFTIETRGSNLPTGMLLAIDGVPVREIYHGGFDIVPPPNSPWAAIDGDIGIEMSGWMSRIADLPGEKFPFRFYSHDPWWINSPWFDRYGREPYDIYLPLSVARLDGKGRVTPLSAIEFLSVDNSWGYMPDEVPNEIIPHILKAFDHSPDRAGPFVWVYPFDEYDAIAFEHPDKLDELLFGDLFISGAINDGFPLNSVISTKNFLLISGNNPELLSGSVLTVPTLAADGKIWPAIKQHLEAGCKVLLYGPMRSACDEARDLLNIDIAEPLEGDFEAEPAYLPDTGFKMPFSFRHTSVTSGGGLEETVRKKIIPSLSVTAFARQGKTVRAIGVSRKLPEWNGGMLAWIRGTNSFDVSGAGVFEPCDPARNFLCETLMRYTVSLFGYDFLMDKSDSSKRNPITFVSRHDNAFMFSGYTPNTTVKQRLRFPQGAPILSGLTTRIENGWSHYAMPPAWNRDCRVFVDQRLNGEISFRDKCHQQRPGLSRRILLDGLNDATVRFYPPDDGNVVMILPDPLWEVRGETVPFVMITDGQGRCAEAVHVSGKLLITC